MTDTFTESDLAFMYFLVNSRYWKVKRERYMPTADEERIKRYDAETDVLRRVNETHHAA